MIKRDLMEVGASIIGGLGIGAALMYLLDPDKGSSRRQWLSQQAHEMADRPGHMMHQATETMRQAGQSMRRKTRGIRDRAAEMMPSMGGMMAEESCPVAKAIGRSAAPVLGAMALGAGLMFMLDPVSGRRRRARIKDKAVHYTTKAEHTLSSTSRHLSNKAKGMYHDAKGVFGTHRHNGGHRLGAVEEHGQQVK